MISCFPSDSFIAAGPTRAPAADVAYEFAFHSSPFLPDLDADGENLVILYGPSNVYALYRRALGLAQAWQRFIQWHPSVSRKAAVTSAREMDGWLFKHRSARAIIDRLGIRNDNGRAFVEEAGAKLVAEDGGEAYYLTTAALQ